MKKQDALILIEECLKELDLPKGSVAVALNKLYRVASLLGNTELKVWCSSFQGNSELVEAVHIYIQQILDFNNNISNKDYDQNEGEEQISKALGKCYQLGFIEEHLSPGELGIRRPYLKDFQSVEFLENIKLNLLARKIGNDGTYYISNLEQFLSFVKTKVQLYATDLYEQLKYSGTINSCFNTLKTVVDNRFLDLNPDLAEQLMTIFKSVNTDDSEQWSHALTSCRRLLEGLADELFPATNELVNGRELKQNQYINRLWAFMDQAIESNSNKDLAKMHIDSLGKWLQAIYKLSNKGVHSEISHLEATKLVFHLYLVLADILDYLDSDRKKTQIKSLQEASIDEMEALADITRNIAKEIVKIRVNNPPLTDKKLLEIKGVGKKTLEKLRNSFSF